MGRSGVQEHAELYIYFHTKNMAAPYSPTLRQLVLTYARGSGSGSLDTTAQLPGDMDGNGTPDIVVSSIDSMVPGLPRPLRIILIESQPGGGMIATERTISGLGMNISVNSHFFHDVNGDGLQDLLRINDTTYEVEYRLNDGTDFIGAYAGLGFSLPMRSGTYERAGGMEPETYYMPIMSKVLVMDYDGNGRQEMLVAGTVLASGCAEVEPIGYRCDDALYAEYEYMENSNVGLPIHADVLDESVRQYTAYRFDETASGAITTTSFVSDIVASATQTAIIDATGDGLRDVVTVFGCRWADCGFNQDNLARGGTVSDPTWVEGAWVNRNRGAATGSERFAGYDLMSAAEDGLGIRHEWTYRPLSSDEYDTAYSAFYETTHSYQASDPDYFHFASSMYVVADHRVSNGVGGLNSTKYRYRGAIFNNKGRGFQGFRSIIVEQDVYAPGHPQASTDKITRTDFHQKWPLSSVIDQACTWLASDNVADDNPGCSNVLSHTTVDDIHNVATSGSARFVAVKAQTERTYGLNTGLLVGTNSVERVFDAYGNVTGESRSHTDDYGTVLTQTAQTFSPNPALWWLDKLTSRTVTHHPVSGRVGPPVAPGTDTTKQVTTTFNAYDTAHRLPSSVTITANDTPLTRAVTTDYNDRGLPTLITTTGTDVSGPRTITTTYTDNGTMVSVHGYFPFTVSNALGHETRRETDPAHGRPTRVIDPNGLVSTMSYDAFGRPLAVTPAGQPPRHVRRFWCDFGCPSGATHWVASYRAGAPETRRYLDALGRERESRVRNFAGSGFIRVRTAYDARGHKTYESQPYDPTAGETGLLGTRYLSYDALGRLQSKEQDQANGTILLTSYGYAGLTTSINAGGLLMHRIYNGLGQLVETRDALGGYTRYAYDGAGNPIVLQDPNGNSIVAKFDALGHKVWVDDPNMGEKTFAYSAVGELLTERDVNCPTSIGCDTISMEYDALGRLVARYANGTRVGRWVYDNPAPDKGLGLLSYEENLSGSHGLQKHYFYSLDGSGRKDLTRVLHRFYVNGSPHTDYITRYYTDSYYGRPKGVRYPGGVGVAYVYNDAGYRVQAKDASSSYVLRQVTARDARNEVLQATLANGTLTYTAEYFEATGQMKAITVAGAAGVVHALDYSYDGFGNLQSRSKAYAGAVSTESFTYDDLHRLRQSSRHYPGGSQVVHYDYDPSGNLTLKDDYATSYAYTGSRPNAVSSITRVGGGTVSFRYDANGNMRAGDGKSLTYTAFNQPASVTAGGVTASFGYGADRARYRQDKSSGETTLYLGQLMEVVQTGSAIEYRHYLGDVAVLTKRGTLTDPAPTLRFLHRDRLGSVVTITDELGEAEGRGYDPFGKPRAPDWANKTPPVLGSAITERGFTDHEHLDASQLIHMNGRVYDYNLGRFLSVDPIIQAPGNSQSLNPYAYIMNNPLAGVDPSGYCKTRTGSHICLRDDTMSAKLSDVSKITTYKDGDRTFAVATTTNGAEFMITGISGPADAMSAVGLGFSTTGINGLPDRDKQSGGEYPSCTPGGYKGIEGNRYWGALYYTADQLTWGAWDYTTVGFLEKSIRTEADIEAFEEWMPKEARFAAGLIGLRKDVVERLMSFLTRRSARNADDVVPNSSSRLGNLSALKNQRGAIGDPNKLNHIFGRADHGLDDLVTEFGSQQQAFEALSTAAQQVVTRKGITGLFEETVQVGTQAVTVRGNVMDGVVKIGTAFKP